LNLILAGALAALMAFAPAAGQSAVSSNIRSANLKDAAYRDAARELHEYWGDDDWVQESSIEGFQVTPAFGDLTGDGAEEAALRVYYGMGGSGSFTGVFVYSLDGGAPRRIAAVKGGDCSEGGIKSVRIAGGQLIVESYTPDSQSPCMACYGGILMTRYEWLGGRFVNVGTTFKSLPRQGTNKPRRRRGDR
jgi:hypothetical protein